MISVLIRVFAAPPLRSLGSGVLAICLTLPVVAQEPPPPTPPPAPSVEPAPPPPSETQKLIDAFVAAMPRNPALLRDAESRRSTAPKALPVLRRIREFVADHADSMLAQRRLEFSIYALVLDEPGLRDELVHSRTAGDANAALLLGSADVIRAADAEHRSQAIAAVANELAGSPVEGDAKVKRPDAMAADCAVQCLAVAAELTAAEASLLAERVHDDKLAARLREVAEEAKNDPRRLLDAPLVIRGTLVGGEQFSTQSLLGKVVLVDFWATWCGPCVRSLPDLVAFRQQYGAKGLAIVGVSCDRTRDALTGFLTAHAEIDWPQLFTPTEKGWHPLATEFGIRSIPRLFLIDKKGVLRSVDARENLAALLARYLAE